MLLIREYRLILKCGTVLRVSGAARMQVEMRLGGGSGASWGGNEYFTRRNGRFDATGRQNTFFSRETSRKRHLYSSTLTHQQLKEPYLFPHSAPFAIQILYISLLATKKPYLFPHFATFAIQILYISPFATKKPYLFPHFATFAIQLRYISPSATSSAPSTSLLCSV